MKWKITQDGELKPGSGKEVFTIPNKFNTKRQAKIIRDLIKKL